MLKDKISILIIESDIDEQDKIVKALKSNAFEMSIEIAEDTDRALLMIIELNPEMVFLEYPLKGKTGMGIIKFIQSKLPQTTIVFMSHLKEHAAEAIHSEVYDFLLRPVRKTEINNLLEKVHIGRRSNSMARMNDLINSNHPEKMLRFNTMKGFIVTNSENILFCKADGCFTELHFTNKSKELTFLYLSQVDEILNQVDFLRVSRSVIVNKNYIRKVNFKTNMITLSTHGEELDIVGSRGILKEFNKYV